MANMELEGILKTLEKSPMFHLSLSDKELFHSNMLAWIFEKYPKFFTSLFDLKEDVKLISVEREQNNFDLFITYEQKNEKKYILIENKVKSIPTQKQLDEYKLKNEIPIRVENKKYKTEELKKVEAAEDRKVNTKYVLISLVKPFWFEKQKIWDYKTYTDISNTLDIKEVDDGYLKQLIDDYKNYILGLSNILSKIENETEYIPNYEFGENQTLKRFASQFHRWRAEIHKKQLFDYFKDKCKGEVNYVEKCWQVTEKNNEGMYTFSSDISSTGDVKEIVSFELVVYVGKKIEIDSKKESHSNLIIFTIQVQGDEFRIMLGINGNNSKIPLEQFREKNDGSNTSYEKSNLWLKFVDVKDYLKTILSQEESIQSQEESMNLQGLKRKSRDAKKDEFLSYFGDKIKYKYYILKPDVKKEAVYEAIYSIHTKLIEALDDENSELNKFKAYLDKEWVDKQNV